jgi:hypothetical protein
VLACPLLMSPIYVLEGCLNSTSEILDVVPVLACSNIKGTWYRTDIFDQILMLEDVPT